MIWMSVILDTSFFVDTLNSAMLIVLLEFNFARHHTTTIIPKTPIIVAHPDNRQNREALCFKP